MSAYSWTSISSYYTFLIYIYSICRHIHGHLYLPIIRSSFISTQYVDIFMDIYIFLLYVPHLYLLNMSTYSWTSISSYYTFLIYIYSICRHIHGHLYLPIIRSSFISTQYVDIFMDIYIFLLYVPHLYLLNMSTYSWTSISSYYTFLIYIYSICRHIHGHLYLPIIRSSFISTQYVDIFMDIYIFLLYVPHLYLLNMSAYSWTSISSYYTFLIYIYSICRHIHGHLYLPIIRSSFISTQYVDIFMDIYIFLLYVPHLYLLNMSAYSWTSISSYYTFLIFIYSICRHIHGHLYLPIIRSSFISTQYVGIFMDIYIFLLYVPHFYLLNMSTYSWTSISSYYTFLIYIYSICRHIHGHLYLPIIRSSFISTQYVDIFMDIYIFLLYVPHLYLLNMSTYSWTSISSYYTFLIYIYSICRHIHGHLYLPIIRSSFISTQYVDIFMDIYIFLLYVPHLYLLNMSAYSWTSISSYYTFLIFIYSICRHIHGHLYLPIIRSSFIYLLNMSTYSWTSISSYYTFLIYIYSICRIFMDIGIFMDIYIFLLYVPHLYLLNMSTYSWTSISSYYTFLIYIYSICRHIHGHLYLPIIRSSFISTQYVGIFMDIYIFLLRSSYLLNMSTYSWTSISSYYTFLIYIYSICRHIHGHLYLPIIRSSFLSTRHIHPIIRSSFISTQYVDIHGHLYLPIIRSSFISTICRHSSLSTYSWTSISSYLLNMSTYSWTSISSYYTFLIYIYSICRHIHTSIFLLYVPHLYLLNMSAYSWTSISSYYTFLIFIYSICRHIHGHLYLPIIRSSFISTQYVGIFMDIYIFLLYVPHFYLLNMSTYSWTSISSYYTFLIYIYSICRHIHGHLYLPIIRSSFISTQYVDIFMDIYIFLLYVPHLYLLNMSTYSWTSISSYYTFLIYIYSICRHIHGHLYLPIIRSSFISTQYVDIFMDIYIFLLYVPHLYLLNMSTYSWTSISS